MSLVEWSEILGWDEEAIGDLRYLGYNYLKQGKYEIASSFFEALTTLSKQNAYDFQTLGGLYLEQGKNFQALNTIEQALRLDPLHSDTLLNRAKALFSLGYMRQAVAQANSLLKDPNSHIANQASALLLAYT